MPTQSVRHRHSGQQVGLMGNRNFEFVNRLLLEKLKRLAIIIVHHIVNTIIFPQYRLQTQAFYAFLVLPVSLVFFYTSVLISFNCLLCLRFYLFLYLFFFMVITKYLFFFFLHRVISLYKRRLYKVFISMNCLECDQTDVHIDTDER